MKMEAFKFKQAS